MGQQTYTDYVKASSDAAHAALRKMHALEDLLTPQQAELLQGFVLTLTQSNLDRLNKPAAHVGEQPTIVIETEATSGNLTAFTRIRKLAEARPVRNEQGELPFPFNNQRIIPKGLASILADLDASGKASLLSDCETNEGKTSAKELAGQITAALGRELTKEESDALSTGKLQELMFDGFLNKSLKKRFGFMGSGFLAVNVWNDSYSFNKWALHVHADGSLVAECLDVTNHIKRNHV